MEFQKVIEERFSVRDYADTPVEQEKIEQILQAGRLAPTALNNQPQKIYVLQSEEAREKIKQLTKCCFNAPVVFLCCGDKNYEIISSVSGLTMMQIDVTIVQTHMMLKATDLGLASCWVCYFKPEDATRIFNLPENVTPYSLLFVGYPSKNAKPSERHFVSKSVDEYATYL